RELAAFSAAHASSFTSYLPGGECDHRWQPLHAEYREIFEKHVQRFLARESMKEQEFLALTRRYSKNVCGEEAEEWGNFVRQLTMCEDFSHFLEFMKSQEAPGLSSGPSPPEPSSSTSGQHQHLDVSDEMAAFFRCLQHNTARQALADFVLTHALEFVVRSKEHRHEWYLLYQEFGRLFEQSASAALEEAGLSLESLASFMVQTLPYLERSYEIQDFLDVCVPAEDYLSFVDLMKGAGAAALEGSAEVQGSMQERAELEAGEQQQLPGSISTHAQAQAQTHAGEQLAANAHEQEMPPAESQEEVGQRSAEFLAELSALERTQVVRLAFRDFLDAPDAEPAMVCFHQLLGLWPGGLPHTSPGSLFFSELNAAVRPELDRRLSGILDCVERRLTEKGVAAPHGRYCAGPLAGVHCVVCGAGPVGLRAAIELRALGAEVSVFEKRRQFSRLNRLKLWEWVKFDLIGWGARQLMPKFGASAGHLHIGIRQLQLLLWKICLLLGVNVQVGVELFEAPDSVLVVRGADSDHPVTVVPCDLLLEAGGPNSLAWPSAGLSFDVTGTAQATGLVANFERRPGLGEELKEFSWARQFNRELFARLQSELHADLENIVYLRGEEAHYFVMTPRHQGLVAAGILAAVGSPLSSASKEALQVHARAIASFFGLPEACGFAAPTQLFDFSKRRSCRVAMQTLGPGGSGSGGPLLVAVVGDALLEPFWPEGLGITRGFLGALDSAWELSSLRAADFEAARSGQSTGALEAACRAREKACKLLKQIGAANQNQYLLADDRAYGLDPRTRYKHHLLA
ncbi:unnamed protein product, partial [Polarella glacialis]